MTPREEKILYGVTLRGKDTVLLHYSLTLLGVVMASLIDAYTNGSRSVGTFEDGKKVRRHNSISFFDLIERVSLLLFSRGISYRLSLTVSFLAALLFSGLASVRLDQAGLYYDELHQAAPSFAYCGKHPPMFCSFTIKGVPVLNMNYSSAIKSGIYGLYLRCSGEPFSVVSWRLLGILMVGLGITVFGVLARDAMSLGGLLFFYSLFLTDATVFLTTRHDWGPVALALGLRLTFIGFWIRVETSTSVSSAFFLGAIASLSVFEKLSSLPLFLPLGFAFFRMHFRKSYRQAVWCLAGVFLGAIPLLGINLITCLSQGRLISFEDVSKPHSISITGFNSFLGNYLSLGEGPGARAFIFGEEPPVRGVDYLLPLLGLAIAYIAVRLYVEKRQWPASASLALGYLLVGLGIYLLPNHTWIHHWIIGTPFQYAALAIAFVELYPNRLRVLWPLSRQKYRSSTRIISYHPGVLPSPTSGRGGSMNIEESERLPVAVSMERVPAVGYPSNEVGRFNAATVAAVAIPRIIFGSLALLLLACNSNSMVGTMRSIMRDEAGPSWHKDFTRLGQGIGLRLHDSVFIATDWGVATQVYCFGNGEDRSVYQPYESYAGPCELKKILKQSQRNICYLAGPNPPLNPTATEKMLHDMRELPGWQEMPIDDDLKGLTVVEVWKFSRVDQFTAQSTE